VDSYPGIEIRLTTPDGYTYFEANSRDLYFDLCAIWIRAGHPAGTWTHVGGPMVLILEARAVDVPAEMSGDELLGALAEQDQAAAAAAAEPVMSVGDVAAAEPWLADLEAQAAAELADQAAREEAPSPCGGCPSITGCAMLGGCQLGPILREAGTVAGYAAAPGPLLGRDTGAAAPGAGPGALAERGQPTVSLRRRLRAGRAFARIARRARFLSGR
jgi:hypothetical protein